MYKPTILVDLDGVLNEYFFIDVTNVKSKAYLYIDDRAIRFDGDFERTLKEIDEFRVYWR